MPSGLNAAGIDPLIELLRCLNEGSTEADRPISGAMRAVARCIGASTTLLYAVEPEAKLQLVGSDGVDDRLAEPSSTLLRVGEEVATQCLAARGPVRRAGARCLHAAPLLTRGEVNGVLVFTHDGDGGIEADHVDVAAGILALALNGRWSKPSGPSVDQRLERTLHAMEELAHVLAGVPVTFAAVRAEPEASDGFDLREFFTLLAERARQLVDAEMAAVGVGTSPERAFDPWVVVGVPPEMVRAVGRRPRPVGTLGAVAIGGKTIRVGDVHRHPAFVGFPPGHVDVRSLLAVPITAENECLGNLYLANKRGADEFDDADQKTIEMFAALAANGLRFSILLRRIEHERTRLAQIIEADPDGVAFVDAASGRILANRAFETLLGKQIVPEDGVAQEIGSLFRPDGRVLDVAELPSSHALRDETTVEQDLFVVRPDGRRIPVSERAVPVHGETGKVVGAVVVLRDISLQKEMERLREEFAAMVAHDLRNPIQSMLIQVQMLRKSIEGGKPISGVALDRLDRLGLRLAQMAGDLLDTTRIELSRVPLSREPLDIAEATQTLVDRVRPTVGDHSIAVHVDEPLPTVMVDPVRFDQILTNLIENAGKYSAKGTPIDVVMKTIDGGVEVAVVDRGFGIAPDELPKLFDRFYQAHRAREQKSGLGLGLYITKGFVEAHGGHITVASTLDRGSTFRVWLPVASPADVAPALH